MSDQKRTADFIREEIRLFKHTHKACSNQEVEIQHADAELYLDTVVPELKATECIRTVSL